MKCMANGCQNEATRKWANTELCFTHLNDVVRLIGGPPKEEPDLFIMALDVGTKVLIGGDIEGEIVAVEIRGATNRWYVNYEVTWWNGRQREKQWLTEQEVRVVGEDKPEHVKVGFRRHV